MLNGGQLFFAISIIALFGLAAIVDVCCIVINRGKHYTTTRKQSYTKLVYDEDAKYWAVQSSQRGEKR